jgi:hypothetical protein
MGDVIGKVDWAWRTAAGGLPDFACRGMSSPSTIRHLMDRHRVNVGGGRYLH